jgi:hypothetical protein
MHFLFDNFCLKNHTAYDIILKIFEVTDRPQMTIWLLRISCWIPKATITHSEYAVLIASAWK